MTLDEAIANLRANFVMQGAHGAVTVPADAVRKVLMSIDGDYARVAKEHDAVDRVRAMADPKNPGWELSARDYAALRTVLDRMAGNDANQAETKHSGAPRNDMVRVCPHGNHYDVAICAGDSAAVIGASVLAAMRTR